MNTRDLRSRDPTIIAPSAEQWLSNPVKLAGDDGEVMFRSAELDGVIVAAMESGTTILEDFSPPPDSLYCAILRRFPAGNMLDGVELPETGILVLEGGREHIARIPAGSRVVELTVPLTLLESSGIASAWRPSQSGSSFRRLLPHETPQRQFLENLMLASLEHTGGIHPLEQPDGALHLADALGAVLRSSTCRTDAPRRMYGLGRYRVIQRAREYIEGSYGDDVSMGDIARHAACSTRLLQLAFKEILGVTPGQYLTARRLCRARELLTHSGRRSVTVLEAATRAGFRHRGRFGQTYRVFFGETPSESLSKVFINGVRLD